MRRSKLKNSIIYETDTNGFSDKSYNTLINAKKATQPVYMVYLELMFKIIGTFILLSNLLLERKTLFGK